MGIHYCDYVLPAGNRQQKRVDLIACFLKEEAGTGKGDDS